MGVHSDRGGQFRARSFVAVLKASNLTGSMGRVSSAGDNAAMESFYSLLQKNVLDRRRWPTRAELAYAILVWIERTYKRRRRETAKPAGRRSCPRVSCPCRFSPKSRERTVPAP